MNIFLEKKTELGITFSSIAKQIGYKQRSSASLDMSRPWRISLDRALLLGEILNIPAAEVTEFWKAERLAKYKEKMDKL